eukprot:TRINITY_DN427_c0_g1_i2.p2 TRINITY_DN427_c0_g1~~TRINITY_DN427_c0_g1_i2.p2  ORF type:complete len:112 (+),score=3.09 TRINITY_DN427_c0_g1_i2:144-479(+)
MLATEHADKNEAQEQHGAKRGQNQRAHFVRAPLHNLPVHKGHHQKRSVLKRLQYSVRETKIGLAHCTQCYGESNRKKKNTLHMEPHHGQTNTDEDSWIVPITGMALRMDGE